MKAIIDILLLVIIATCTWNGHKRGLIGGIAGLIAIVISLFGATMLSSAYSSEVIPAFRPFVKGIIDSQSVREEVMEAMGYDEDTYSLDDILNQDPSLRYSYAHECMTRLGLHEKRANELAGDAVKRSEQDKISMTDAVSNVLCETLTYVAGLALAFIMILILLVALANIGNLSFRLPNMENLDEIGGVILGFAKGFSYCLLLCWLLSYLGIVIGRTTMDDTILGRFFLSFDSATKALM